MQKQKVCIIGAGIGGLTAGVLLLKNGYSVDIYEKESMVGGRAHSLIMTNQTLESYTEVLNRFKIKIIFSDPPLSEIFRQNLFRGYILDLGFHLIGGGIVAKLREITPESFNRITLYKSRLFEQKNSHFGYFVTTKDKLSMLPNIIRLMLSGEKTMKKLDTVPVSKTIQRYGKGKMKDVLELNPRLITTINNLSLISTGEVFRTQKEMRLRGVYYPRNGLFEICRNLASFFENNGGHIYVNTPVSKICIKDQRVEGIEVDRQFHKYDVVISDILVQDIFSLADESFFPNDYVVLLKSLQGTGSLCAYYAVNHIDLALVGKTFVFVERGLGIDGNDAAGMIDFMTAMPDGNSSTSGQYLIQSYIICSPEEAQDTVTLLRLRDALDRNLNRIIPNYTKDLLWAIYPTTWHLDGVAKTVQNVKPDIQTPIKNFYIIGDGVKATGIGINCAINSAFDLINILQ